jgi:hypothetical protein
MSLAPLHTKDVERALKKHILHWKNSLFFQTFAGSGVGDLFRSLRKSSVAKIDAEASPTP